MLLKKKLKTSPNYIFLLLIKHTCFYKTLLPLDSAGLSAILGAVYAGAAPGIFPYWGITGNMSNIGAIAIKTSNEGTRNWAKKYANTIYMDPVRCRHRSFVIRIRSPKYRVKLYFSVILIILQAAYSNKLLALTKELYAKARSCGPRDGQKRCCGGETDKKKGNSRPEPGSVCRSRIGLHTHQRACRQGRQKSHKSSDLRDLPSLSPTRRRSHMVCCPY